MFWLIWSCSVVWPPSLFRLPSVWSTLYHVYSALRNTDSCSFGVKPNSDVVISVKQVTAKHFREEGKYLPWFQLPLSQLRWWNDSKLHRLGQTDKRVVLELAGLWHIVCSRRKWWRVETDGSSTQLTGTQRTWATESVHFLADSGAGDKIIPKAELFLSLRELLYQRHKMWKYHILDIET